MSGKRKSVNEEPSQELESAMLDAQEEVESQPNPEPQPEPQPETAPAEVPAAVVSKEPKFLPMVLLILQIIGAIPSVIAAAEKLWDWIQQIKDRKQKYEMRSRFRQMVYGRRNSMNRQKKKVMSSDENSELEREIEVMTGEVAGILEKQGG